MIWIQMGRLAILSCPQGRIDETNQEQTKNIAEHTDLIHARILQNSFFTIG